MSTESKAANNCFEENTSFLVGTQYYRPPTPMPEDWARDLENIRNHGMNIIRLWLVWSWMNPSPGKYDFDDVEKILGLCKQTTVDLGPYGVRCYLFD